VVKLIELVHSKICQPFLVKSLDALFYFMTFVDDKLCKL
jgi:hypothetical protein